MPGNDYHFTTRWQVEATPEEIFPVLDDAPGLVRWWPAVYLDVQVLEPGDDAGEGAYIELYTKGWLPYTLRWRFRVVDKQPPTRLALKAEGDFVGRGLWTLSRTENGTEVIYDWRIRAEKPLLRYLSFLLRPLFSANHRWAMAQGERSLHLEVARRRARTPEAAAAIAAPPGPTPTSTLPWLRALLSRR